MATYRMLKTHSGARDAFGLDVRTYRAGEVVPLPDSLGLQWVSAGIAERVSESEDPKVAGPAESKPAASAAYKDSRGEVVSTVSVKRRPLKKKR